MNLNKKLIPPVILAAIVILGAFLRFYNFSDWLHFELDQARDAIFVSEGVKNGPAELPILGPKASGTALRVGPAYYYLEYLSAIIFGDTPAGHAIFVAVLNTLSIFFFYFLVKHLFRKEISLGLTLLYSLSAYFVLYSRFSWNPNLLPPFILAAMLGILKTSDKHSRRKGAWFIFTSAVISIGTQLHFVSFFALPSLAAIYFFLNRPALSKKIWAAGILTGLLFYVPVALNEIQSNGQNTREFVNAFSKKGDSEHNLAEKISKNILSQSEGYALILSGNDRIVTPKLKIEGFSIKTSCADHCKKTSKLLSASVILFFILGSLALLWKTSKKESSLRVAGIWFGLVFLVFTFLAYDMAPRFFLLLFPLPFIFLGILIDFFWQKSPRTAGFLFLIIILSLSYLNLEVIKKRFSEMSEAQNRNLKTAADHILEEPTRVTLFQQKEIARYLFEKHQKNGWPLNVVYSDPHYRRSIKYLTESLGASIAPIDELSVYQKSNPVIILRSSKEGNDIFGRYGEFYVVEEKKEFGTLAVYSLSPRPEKITAENAPAVPMVESVDAGDIERVTWRDALKRK